MAADPLAAQAPAGPDPSQGPSQAVSGSPGDSYGPQDPSQQPPDPSKDPQYVAGCILQAIEVCAHGIEGSADDAEACSRYATAIFQAAQGYEKVAGKAAPPVDPNQMAKLDQRHAESEQKLQSSLNQHHQKLVVDFQKHSDNIAQNAADKALKHLQEQQKLQVQASKPEPQQQAPPQKDQPQQGS